MNKVGYLNRTHAAVLNTLIMYITIPEMQTPHYSDRDYTGSTVPPHDSTNCSLHYPEISMMRLHLL